MNKTGTRLFAAILGYFVLIILLLTLNPFYLARPERIHFAIHSSFKDLISNILLFIPIGFFYRLATRQHFALLLGAIISISIETMQLFIPVRTPSLIDILANTLSAGLGAALHDVISKRIVVTQGTIGRLRLETPLMGLMYMLLPLLWANSLTLNNTPARWILTALIGIIGAIVLSEVFRHWWEVVDIRVGGYTSLAAGLWFLVGTGPAILQPTQLLIVGLGVALLAATLTAIPQNNSDRRFEHITLRRIIPVFALYLIILALWNPTRPLTAWHWTLGFTDQATETSMQGLNPRIEYLVAFTVLGYLLAEWRGRAEIPLTQDLPRLFLYAIGISLGLEILVGFQVGPGASLIRVAVAIASAIFGGTIYHLLRAHIRFLLKH